MGQIHQAQIRARKTYWLGRVSSPQSFSIGLGMAVLSPGLLLWVPFWGYWGYYVARWPFKIANPWNSTVLTHTIISALGVVSKKVNWALLTTGEIL